MNKIGVGTWECSDRERELVNEVLDSGRLSYGPYSKALEYEFAKIHAAQYGVLSNSGTSSLQVALQAMKELHGWKDGDEVIIPAVTFVATANIILHNNLTPVLVDVSSNTYNMNMSMAMDAVTKKTRAIIPVHLFGQPANMSWLTMFKTKNIKVIEDACEAAFASQMDHPVGSWGDIGCFSFYIAHLLTTGVGGIGITNNPDYAAKMRSIVNHGRDGIYIDIDTEASREVVARRFKFDTIGHSYRITELEAALGLAQLEVWEEMIANRRVNAEYLTSNLESLGNRLRLPYTSISMQHSWMMYPLVVENEPKWGLVNHLEGCGIETREMLPLTNQPCYKGMWDESDYPIAKKINDSGFYIGCHQGLSISDLDRIVESIKEYFDGNA
jgi:dTDP-4-amino-4,6-dideoxygalactose transaminase